MRRFFAGAAFMALAAAVPINAFGGDREIATEIIKSLKTHRDAGALKGFTLDLKVENGNVLFLGEVANSRQQQLVLDAAKGVDGVKNVVNQLSVQGQPTAPEKAAAQPASKAASPQPATPAAQIPAPGQFSLRQALKTFAPGAANTPAAAAKTVAQVAATEDAKTDAEVTSAIESHLQAAMKKGELKGFGVAIDCENGNVWLKGQAASAAQKETILKMVRGVAGVRNVVDNIAIRSQMPRLPVGSETQAVKPVSNELELPQPPSIAHPVANAAPRHLRPVAVRDVPVEPVSAGQGAPVHPAQGLAGAPAAGTSVHPAGYPVHGGVVAGGAVAGGVPAAYPATVGMGYAAPRYEQPYMPNYAWPGYAAYPNYAAVTYPQQYSPSAWPYIGPFYPYPQVPLGWRKVALEWDDGWWYLDFTDK